MFDCASVPYRTFAVISYNQWWHGSVYDESLIAEIFLWIFSFSIGGVPLGLLLIWDSYRHDYKLDENGDYHKISQQCISNGQKVG